MDTTIIIPNNTPIVLKSIYEILLSNVKTFVIIISTAPLIAATVLSIFSVIIDRITSKKIIIEINWVFIKTPPYKVKYYKYY